MKAAWVSDRAPSLSFACVSELLIVWGDLLAIVAISIRFNPDLSSSRI